MEAPPSNFDYAPVQVKEADSTASPSPSSPNPYTLILPSDPEAFNCQEPSSINTEGLRKVIDNIENEEAARIYVVWKEAYKPKVFEIPQSVDGYLDEKFCRDICSDGGARGFRGCEAESNQIDEMFLNIVLTTCSFTDRGSSFKGGIYNEHMYMVAAHAGAKPSFQRSKVQRFDKLAIGLAPYSHTCSSHFFSSTSPMVLTLAEVLPDDVKLLVNWSECLEKLYARFPDLDRNRLVVFDDKTSYYAKEMYSLVPSPYGEHGAQGGEPMSDQSFERVRVGLHSQTPPQNEQRTKLILIDRSDTKGNRACSNHEELKKQLETNYGSVLDVVSFRGSDMSQEENEALFQRAAVVVAPHGGALMNMFYALKGTKVVEIGYWGRGGMCFPSFFMSMAMKLLMDYWLVMAEGTYSSPLDCPIEDILKTLNQIIM